MIRRRPVARTAARTAVVAGTATAVSGRVARRQRNRAMEQTEQPASPPAPAASGAGATPASASGGGISEASLGRLTSLAELRDQGVLTEAEFAEQKARILESS